MRELWEIDVENASYYRKLSDERFDKYEALSKELLDVSCERNALKGKCSFFQSIVDTAARCWCVTLPINLMCENKILCIKAYRDVFPVGLREAKEEVERKIEHGEQLFKTFLTTEQMLKAFAAFEDRQNVRVTDLEVRRVEVRKD